MNSTSELKNQQLLVQESGQMSLDTVIPRGSELKFVDMSSIRMLRGEEDFTLPLDSKIRFSPGSHIGVEYNASDFKNEQNQSLQGNFKVAVSLSLSADGRNLITAVAASPKDVETQFRPGGVLLDFYTTSRAITHQQAGVLPQYAVRDTVRATRIEALRPDPTNPAVSLAITNPPIDGLRISTRSTVALGKGKTALPGTNAGVSSGDVSRNPAGQQGQSRTRLDQQSMSGDESNAIQGMADGTDNRSSALINNSDGVLELQGGEQIVPGDFLTLEADGTMRHVPENLFQQRYEQVNRPI